MKNFFLSLALLVPIVAFSSEKDTHVIIPMPVVCDLSKKILDVIKEYDEKLVFVGIEVTDKNSVHLWKNNDTGSFTIVVTPIKSDYSCILSTGTTSRQI